jgi:beta propeller repeat protein
MKITALKQLWWSLPFILWAMILSPNDGHAAQQYQGLCSYVKIEILQELALERIGFLATLTVTNNEGDGSITDFSASLTFEQEGEGGEMEDASHLFFVQPPKVKGVTSIDGDGIINPGQTAVVEWFIIPKVSAGGTTPEGLRYEVGALLGGSIYGMEISQDVFRVLPDTITVKPDPELEITYFQPRDVDGDNPFTPYIVESPVPFTLGVLVKNVGYGTARKVRIASEQPRIVENLQGLLVVPQLIGARVDDEPTDSTTLTVNLGDIEPGRCRKGAWDMITTLSGEFTEFRASYTHAPELGGQETSVIRSINAYFIVHEVMNDQPGRDNLLDFLAETLGGEELIPDTLYESDCNTLPVNRLTDVEVLDFSALTATIRANADFENWVFMRLDDPGQAKYPIASVVRSDGKVLNPNNYWTHIRYREPDNAKLTYLNIFDFVALGEVQYTVTYEPLGTDEEPPVTTILLSGPSEEKNGTYYILPETQIFFIAEDDSPVGTYYRLDGAVDFVPAYPFTIPDAGTHTLEFYSKDIVGNEETPQVVSVVVSVDDPAVENLTTDTEELFIAGDSLSVRPTRVTVDFNGLVTAAGLEGVAEVFRGVFGYPTVSGAPSSPTSSDSATLVVGGENVDFYRYRMGGGDWSVEHAVSKPISLTGLSGAVQLSVSGRSQYGDYHPDSEAVEVFWTVNPGAAAIAMTGTPETPSRSPHASLTVTGSDYYCYRVDGVYYWPDAGPGSPIVLTNLRDGEHAVEVLARADEGASCPGDVPGTMVRWTVDRQYGLRLPMERRVRYEDLGQVDDMPQEFVWDGRTDSGAVAPPGWYTILITVTDGLGRSGRAVILVYVGDMVAGGMPLSDAGNASQKEAHAFGRWAVWQDQRAGNWDIYAKDLQDDAAVAFAVKSNVYNQERPRSDGRYVVWEDRQADGTWDIWAKDLDSVDPNFPVTQTPAFDEKKPVVYWPWIVYQAKPVSNPSAPWQLKAHNLLTGTTEAVDATTQNQLDPSVHKQRLVWQDFRDAGYGEIYFKDLESGAVRRITDDPGGQYHPVIFDHWIVWSDNRALQFDLYGYNLKRQAEIQLTNTPEDETRPYLNGDWVVYQEDSGGELNINLRLLHLANLASVQLTNEESQKENASMASSRLVWVDLRSGRRQVMAGPVPDLQPVFNNRNTVAVTKGMVASQGDAYTLLRLWNEQAGVSDITRYTSLLPQPVADTVTWVGTAPVGNNFTLEEGNFLWVRFNETKILDLGQSTCTPLNLAAGVNAFSYSCFPDSYSAYRMIRELGPANVNALRVLDSNTGRWQVAIVNEGVIAGEDFKISSVAVLMVDLNTTLGPWRPGETL